MRRVVPLASGLVLLGLVFWLLWGQGWSPVDREGLTSPAEENGSPVTSAASGLAATPETPPVAIRNDPDLGQRAVQDPGGLEVIVYDGGGHPVPEAFVTVVAGVPSSDIGRFKSLDLVDEWMIVHGEPRVSDAAGTFRIQPPADLPTCLHATSGLLWGTRRVEPGEPAPIVLRMEHDYPLEVEVFDGLGQLCSGVTVQLWQKNPWPQVRRRARTDEGSGLALFPHVQRSVGEGGEWTIGLEVPLADPIAIALDPTALPEGVVTIQLPATGSVEVTLLSEQGELLQETVEVVLSVAPDAGPRSESYHEESLRRGGKRRVTDGVVSFPLVEVGTRLEVAANRLGLQPVTRVSGAGPSRMGERVSLEVQLGADHPIIVLRAVDEMGVPMSGAKLSGIAETYRSLSSRSKKLEKVTDEDGSVRFDLEPGWSDEARRTLRLTIEPAGGSERCATLDLSYELPPGLNDLGDVVFPSERPIFAAGLVVGSAGVPIPGASIGVYGQVDGEERWIPDIGKDWVTDQNGAFEIVEASFGDRFRIGASHAGLAGRPIEFLPGDRNLVIVLDVEGVISGSILLDPAVPEQELRVGITEGPDGFSLPVIRGRLARLGGGTLSPGGNSFRLGALRPGTYTVSVGIWPFGSTLATVPDVVVHAGEVNRDPRLQGIDLRGALHVHRLTIEKPESLTFLAGYCGYRRAGTTEWDVEHRPLREELVLVAPHERIDLEILAVGCRAVHLDDVAGEIELVLSAGIPVQLRLPDHVPLPEPPLHLKAQLVPRGAASRWPHHPLAPAFDERRLVIVDAPGPGEMEVIWSVETRFANSGTEKCVLSAPKRYLEVLDVEGEQTFVLEVTPEEMAEIVAAGR